MLTTREDMNLWAYTGNQPASWIAAVLFGVSTGYHLYQMIQKRTWFYSALIVGGLMMTAGYISRVLSIRSPTSLILYILQSVFILLPPSLYAATIYMIYGRLVIFVNAPDASLIRPTRITKIFVIGDIISFLIQAQGGTMVAKASTAKLGQKIILVGLFAQLLFFGFFLVMAITFGLRVNKSPMRYTIQKHGKFSWRALYFLLLGAAAAIIVRCAYRVVEFSMGQGGYIMTHEWCMYLGDTLPMFIVQAAFNFVHAGDVFPSGPVEKREDESYINLEERA